MILFEQQDIGMLDALMLENKAASHGQALSWAENNNVLLWTKCLSSAEIIDRESGPVCAVSAL